MSTDNNIVCPNCANRFDADFKYCPECGQINKKINLGFRHILSELLSANFNLDSKIFVSLKLLITKPGFLTREYLAGRRTKYITPIRLYLVISVFYFFIAALNFGNKEGVVKWNDDNIVTSENQDSIKLENVVDIIKNDTLTVDNDTIADEFDVIEETVIEKSRILGTESGKNMFNNLFRKYISTGMFALIPLTALIFFWVFHKGTYYFEHLIFSFHLQSVIFLIFTLNNMIEWFIDSDFIDGMVSLLLIFSIYIWIKKFYKIGYFKAMWKMLVFFMGYIVLLMLFFGAIIIISFINLEA